ncbi:rhamnan synthesis F family protein [Vibrio rumoiensis]|uniref:rhamnan synthesis F family protein n=1 Tax=Vibrio rumoiensis TaxID=76258 RepID=UPI003749A280
MKYSNNSNMMKRAAFYLFYDKDGIVDDYILHKLTEFRKSVDSIFVVSNSALSISSRDKLETVSDVVYCRENVGFDVWAYKEALEVFGQETLLEYDEIILLNYTFFGPIFPFEEMFDWSESKDVDFWGVSDHKEMIPNPFTGEGVLPRHIQSHFIAIRRKLFSSQEFLKYWDEMPMINSYIDSVLMHESRFTEHFHSKGYSFNVYCNSENYPSDYPTFINVDQTIRDRCPILKRRLFFHDPNWLDVNCVDLNKAISIIGETSDFNMDNIWSNVSRTTRPRTLLTNAELLKVFPSESIDELDDNKRIAVIAHIYYANMCEEIKEYLDNIPSDFDLFITTASEKDKIEIESVFSGYVKNLDVRVVEFNRGRDISSLLISCKDIVLDGQYDFICRLHSKKSPQNGYNNSQYFKYHMYDNLLYSKGYVTNLLNFMIRNKHVGIMSPSMIHIGYPTMGHSWFGNKSACEKYAELLEIKVPFDENTPHAAYGTMYWFKPKALKRLFSYEWKWSDFNEEPFHLDGSLSHVIERLIHYCAHNDGYLAYNTSTTRSIEKSYLKLEYKYQDVMSTLSNGDLLYQINKLKNSDDLEEKVVALENQIAEIMMSSSWRLTLPIRNLKLIYSFIIKKLKI